MSRTARVWQLLSGGTKTRAPAILGDMLKTPNARLPVVWMDVSVEGEPAERVAIRLFEHIAPKDTDNFIQLCTGEKGPSYKGSRFHRILPGSLVHGGDIIRGDGRSGMNADGASHPSDAKYSIGMHRAGLVCNYITEWPNVNSQFFITTRSSPWLTKSVAPIGEVVMGMDTLWKMEEQCGTASGTPRGEVVITDCGKLDAEIRM
eukprot:TRINITY_DN67717_c8_g5_i2.p1 TRINITY_DN67717_c8_g5~~TRINITY_DN67717_c8_g5_i2.p1  ORF type:complete len:204 (-),score=2.87 TRINITY_DN67717_c8_g5_i2:382-993(-)